MEIDDILAKKKILDSIREYIDNKRSKESWTPGEDWLAYSGPVFTAEEYIAAVDTLLDGWLIYGKKCREFETEFSKYMGTKDGVLTNSGSSANLLMVSAFTSKKMKAALRLKAGDKVITPCASLQPLTLSSRTALSRCLLTFLYQT
mgnify:CR=1 FL=1